MTYAELPPDVIGHMASLADTSKPLEICESCIRAVMYGTLAHLGQAGSDLMDGDFAGTARHIEAATRILLELAKVDFSGSADVDDLPDDVWKEAMSAFLHARADHYVDYETGEPRFEPHDDGSDPAVL